MKLKGIPKFLGIVMLIGQDLLWIHVLLQGSVFSLEETLFLRKTRKKL